jgi:predicted porin
MKTKLIGAALALGIAAMPLASIAAVGGGNANSNWTIYGWQNYSYNFIDVDRRVGNDRSFDRIDGNAANIGFAASIDTGVSMAGTAVKANVQCEQFTFFNQLAGGSGWCNRNSKLSLSGAWGEIGFAIWLLPFNEMVAQWVDPFYDAGLDSHTSIMGTNGLTSNFFNGGTFSDTTLGGDFDYSDFTVYDAQFNRRQENLLHWWSPNWNGLQARLAVTAGNRNESRSSVNGYETDPRIWSTGVTYTKDIGNDNLWLAVTYEKHDEWVAASQNSAPNGLSFAGAVGPVECSDSDDDAWRVAGRYIHDWGNGHSTQLSAMYEMLKWEQDCADTGAANAAAFSVFNDLEIDHWMISGKHNFPGPLDFRFSYMDADDYECGGASIAAGACIENDTAAQAYNLGIYYTMPAGTELRLVYSNVDNDSNATYDFGINGAGASAGDEVSAIGIGLVQWF